ncbi:MAG: hypothetical protein LBL01_04185 [Bifidobacteriaceae bacterium]|jgi:hypothetical protein|nr:hypothetical protein [Bifidobacteriaceae bacterium]
MKDQDTSVRHSYSAPPRSKTWLWVLLLAVVLAGSAAAVWLALRGNETEAEPVPTHTITVTPPPPTPTVEPSPREDGTDFYNELPSEVGAYVLVETAPSPEFEAAKAYDSYLLTYTDGQNQITLLAGQWRTDAAATDAFNELGGPAGWPGADVDLTSTVCPDPPAGDAEAIWRNETAVFQVNAPKGGAAEFFCRMPL